VDAHGLACTLGLTTARREVLCVAATLAGVLALAHPQPASGFVTDCSPALNGPNAPPAGEVIAPYVRVVKSSFGLGTCDTPIRVAARSADGALWGWDNRNGLWKSTDNLASWHLVYNAVGFAQIENVLPLSSGRLLILVRDANRGYHVLRSTDKSATEFDPQPVLDMPANGRLLGSQSWVEVKGSIYAGEYGDPASPVLLWRSNDGGQTFSVAASFDDVRHIHSVQADPSVSGRIWVTIGDSVKQSRIGYSDDAGRTFKFITDGVYPRSRAVSLMFTRQAVYWGTDTPDVPAGLYRWDRKTKAIDQVLDHLNGPFYFAVSHDGLFAQFSAIETGNYIGDQRYHVLSSDGAKSWRETTTPLMRAQDDANSNSVILGITPPDSRGRFWVDFWNLVGADYRTSNIEFQLDATAGALNRRRDRRRHESR
jgi:hypothetical protein